MEKNNSISWYSQSYGYNNDLMYFYPIFLGMSDFFCQMKIPVSVDFPVSKYPDLPLIPVLNFKKIKRKAAVGGVDYSTTSSIPSFGTLCYVFRNVPAVTVVIEFSPIAICGIIAAKIFRRKLILLVETDPKYRGAPNGKLVKLFKSLFALCADVVMTSNEDGAKFLKNDLRVPKERIVVKPYLTSDPSFFLSDKSVLNGKFLNRRVDKVNFLYLNSINPRKGLSQLVDAVLTVSEEIRSEMFFHIAGTGEDLEIIKAQVSNLQLDGCFEFYGAIPFKDIFNFYNEADVFVSPTLADYRSLAGFEAICTGKPVLISKYDGAASEVVLSGKNGWVFDPTDKIGFSELLCQFINKPELIREFSEVSRLHSQKFKYQNIVNNLCQTVGELVI